MTVIPKNLHDFRDSSSPFPFFMRVDRVKSYEAHRHDFIECTFVIGGYGREYVNGLPHPMRPGTFSLILPHQIHSIEADPGEILTYYKYNVLPEVLLGVDSDRELETLLYGGEEDLPPYFVVDDKEQRAEMERTCRELLAEYEGHSPWRQTMIRCKLTGMIAAFDRLRRNGAMMLGAPVTAKSFWNVVGFIRMHYREELTLGRLAEQFHLNPTYISGQFKKRLGLHFVDFLHDVRMRHACSLLASTDMAVADIAVEVGCGSSQTFYRVFRKWKGMTPNAYREERRGNRLARGEPAE